MSCQQMIQRCPKAIDICSGIRLPAPSELLWRRIPLCAKTGRVRDTCRFVLSRSSKIDDHNIPIRSEHHIGRLHITINDRRFS